MTRIRRPDPEASDRPSAVTVVETTDHDRTGAEQERFAPAGLDSLAVASANPIDEAKELQTMLVDYAKQETVEPLKDLGRYLAHGLGGSVLVFLGFFFVGLGVLRGMQSLSAFDGVGVPSVAPYAITLLVLGIMIALIYRSWNRAVRRIEKRP